MYAGQAAQVVVFNLPSKIQGVSVFSALPGAGLSAPPPARRRPAWRNLIASNMESNAHARIWKFKVNWTTPLKLDAGPGEGNITICNLLDATELNSRAKNENDLASWLGYGVMMQNRCTNVGGVESLWVTHTVGNGSGIASVRWYQFRVTGGTVQTTRPRSSRARGTRNAAHRWMPSLAVNAQDGRRGGRMQRLEQQPVARQSATRVSAPPIPGDAGAKPRRRSSSGTASQFCKFSLNSTDPGDVEACRAPWQSSTRRLYFLVYIGVLRIAAADDLGNRQLEDAVSSSFRSSTVHPVASLVPDGAAPTATNAPDTTATHVR